MVRHNYVNDIGDYATYALLRALCTSGPRQVRLGLIWYLTDHVEVNGDGRHRAHLVRGGWERLDPDLLTRMRAIEAELGARKPRVDLIERSEILPADTVYFSEAVPGRSVPARQRADRRRAWFARAREAVRGCDLLFLDPDNGLEVGSVPPTSPTADKYATVTEVAELLTTGAGVILYQHGDRSTWEAQRERVSARITSAFPGALATRCLRFTAFGRRAFLCLSTRSHDSETIEAGLNTIRNRIATWDKARYFSFE